MFETALNTPLVVVKNYTNISKISGRIQQFFGGVVQVGSLEGGRGGVTVSPPLGRRPGKFWLFYILNSSNKTSLSWLMNGHLFIFTLINFYTLRVSLGV